jgi:hypothetical protein
MSYYRRFVDRDSRWVVAILFLISVVIVMDQDIELRYGDPQLFKASRGYIDLDHEVVDLVKGKGLFLHFVNFPEDEQWIVLAYYYRFTYVLYPAPVLATDPTIIVFTIEQLLNANFDPSAAWLIDHGTNCELTYTWHTSANSADWSLAQVGPTETGEGK